MDSQEIFNNLNLSITSLDDIVCTLKDKTESLESELNSTKKELIEKETKLSLLKQKQESLNVILNEADGILNGKELAKEIKDSTIIYESSVSKKNRSGITDIIINILKSNGKLTSEGISEKLFEMNFDNQTKEQLLNRTYSTISKAIKRKNQIVFSEKNTNGVLEYYVKE
ncbi:MAG: hypothetical protein RL708_1940 [Bacteroidota bacterium]|jgi:hypothetical protein